MYVVELGYGGYLAVAPAIYRPKWSWFVVRSLKEATLFPRVEEAATALVVRAHEEGTNMIVVSRPAKILKVEANVSIVGPAQ